MRKKLGELYANYDALFYTNDLYLGLVSEAPVEGNLAYLLLLALNGHSRAKLTDGEVSMDVANVIGFSMRVEVSPLLELLESAPFRLIERRDSTIRLVKYHKWQNSRSEIEKRRADAAKRQEAHRALSRNHVTRDVVHHVTTDKKRQEETRRDKQSIKEVFDLWVEATRRSGRILMTDKRVALIAKALSLYPVEDVRDAVQGWRWSPHHRGETDGKVWNDLELLLRDAQHIERFRDWERGINRPGSKIVQRPAVAVDLDEETRAAFLAWEARGATGGAG